VKRATARCFALAVALLLFGRAHAAEVIPPPPSAHFNDYAKLVDAGAARALDNELAQFERDTSNQIIVAIFPRMQTDSSVEDYTVRVAQSWRVGQKDRKNGAVLFVFAQEHQVYIQVGYGLEGALPDALCKQIIENEIVPRFRAGDFTGGITAGVHAVLAATRGEYRGTGRTQDERSETNPRGALFPILLFVVIFVLIARSASRRNVLYQRGGRRTLWMGGGPWGGFGGGSGGGGGGFSGGGGSFGGGGAGGKW
jgi:uncharacterized protein